MSMHGVRGCYAAGDVLPGTGRRVSAAATDRLQGAASHRFMRFGVTRP